MYFLVFLAVSLLIYLLIKPMLYWKERGVKHATGYPIVGNTGGMLLRKMSFLDMATVLYNKFPNERYNGIFQFTQPFLLIRDLDLIKQIGVKEFEHFTDHRGIAAPEDDPFMGKNLIALKGDTWKEMRSILSPAFTGNKMKAMFPLMLECSDQFVDYFKEKNEAITKTEMKDVFTRFANDVIATCAFGVTCDSLRDRENAFYMMGKDGTDLGGLRNIRFLIFVFLPQLCKLLKIQAFPRHISEFFIKLVKDSIAYRTEKQIVRPDMIHLMMEARKGKLKYDDAENVIDAGFSVVEESSIGKQQRSVKSQIEVTDMDIASQAFLFFFAGFDTVTTAMSFMAYELALNPDAQERLHQEVVGLFRDEKLSYESINSAKYLDMVISETLRKWPPAPMTDRLCTKDFVIKGVKPGERDFTIKAGENVMIPIYALHMNENYFPNPGKFDPERFSDENKKNIIPDTYLPFGIGPRACIGSRFALLETKILFARLVQSFEFVPIEESVVPLKVSPKSLRMQPEGGFWLGLKQRK